MFSCPELKISLSVHAVHVFLSSLKCFSARDGRISEEMINSISQPTVLKLDRKLSLRYGKEFEISKNRSEVR